MMHIMLMDGEIDRARITEEFAALSERTWLNCAHQGPLPRVAQRAAQKAIDAKARPHLIEDVSFWQVPAHLRRSIATLITAPSDEVVLGNATSYGLNLLAQGIDLKPGDEILLVDGDFPATVIPWMPLKTRGVQIRFLGAAQGAPTRQEFAEALTDKTRVFCSSWVFSFTGHAIDLQAFGELCRARDVLFIVNGSQAIGARPIDVSQMPIDALVSAGFKWLCGPYGTGFCWMRKELMMGLTYEQRYWLAQMQPDDLSQEGRYETRKERLVQDYDLFCPANFLNFLPWLASIQLLTDLGVDVVAQRDQHLVDRLVRGLDRLGLDLLSPSGGSERSTLVLFTHPHAPTNDEIFGALGRAGIDVAMRNNHLRISPHLYNTEAEIDEVLNVLEQWA